MHFEDQRPVEDETDEESDDDQESEDEGDLKTKTELAEKALTEMLEGNATEDAIKHFFYNHGEAVTRDSDGEETFLHRIVQLVSEKKIKKASDVKPLVKLLMETHPHVLRITNSDGQNALYCAIRLKKPMATLVGYMVSYCSDKSVVKEALEAQFGEDRSAKTCLTLAFEKGLRDSVLEKLVDHASSKALKFRDGSGRTPFHYAVQYDQCSDTRLGVIKLLLEKDSDAIRQHKDAKTSEPLETFLDLKYQAREGNVKCSIYGEHQRTAEVYKEQLARKEREAKKAREEDLERASGKAANLAVPMRESDPPKTGLDKGSKSRAAETRDRRTKRPDRDRENIKQEHQNMDENERRCREQEEREHQERKAREEKKQHPNQLTERLKQPKDSRERPDDPTLAAHRSHPEHTPNTALKRAPTLRFNVDDGIKKKDRRATSLKKAEARGSDPKALASNSARVLTMLKLHYMRTRSIKRVTSFLYGKNVKDVQLCFDYQGLPPEIRDSVFEERFGEKATIRFDEVLMYVRFPDVAVIRTGKKAPKRRAAGRQDMEFFFKWLYAKGVRRILKVEVKDSDKIPHGDESIQLSLDKIVVEQLDWQKTDLDPRVICQLGRNVPQLSPYEGEAKDQLREVTLKWSGSNAVLRAWSEPEGLPQLEGLEAVNLLTPAYSDLLDSWPWVEANIKEFHARLNLNADENWKAKTEKESTTLPQRSKIKVVHKQCEEGDKIAVSGNLAPKPSEPVNPQKDEHEWLKCMEKFADAMLPFWEMAERDCDQPLNIDGKIRDDIEKLRKPVVVALIDDGVHYCDPAFTGRAIEGKTFDYQDDMQGIGQCYISRQGHGTEMAKLIFKVCPMASIYSIRLKTHTSPSKGHLTVDAISAALAIEAALEKNATIISMSWTIPVPEDGSNEKEILDPVLRRACEQNVLMFCSSSDRISATDHYPSSYKRERFFRIGAAHPDGSPFGLAGCKDFIFPGVNVNTSGGRSLPAYLADKTSSSKESTGSSIATALAAGLAAMITYCVKASALATAKDRTQQGKSYVSTYDLGDVDRIAKHNVLSKAFNKINSKTVAGPFIPVWDRFESAAETLSDDKKTEKAKVNCLMNLCSNIIER